MSKLQANHISRSSNKSSASSSPTTIAQDDIEQFEAAMFARQKFIGATINLSWRLALTVLIPLIAGIQLDKKLDSSPSFVITGFMLAIVFGCMTVWQAVKEVNKSQAEESRKKKS